MLTKARIRHVSERFATMSAELARYVFVAKDEAELQGQVSSVLESIGLSVVREHVEGAGRYDILVVIDEPGIALRLVIELKIKGQASAAERQAQRYAKIAGIDGVMLVTTSSRLAAQIKPGNLGGKPFAVVALRAGL